MITGETKKELDRLSLKFLGASSKWQKLANQGRPVPTLNEDGTDNHALLQIKRMSPEEILESLKKLEEAVIKMKEEKAKSDTVQEVMQKATGVLNVEELSKNLV